MSKIRILAIPPDAHGVGKFRISNPYSHLQEHHGDDFHIDLKTNVPDDDKEFENYDIIVLHSFIHNTVPFSRNIERIMMLKSRGKIVIVDIDDYWTPDMRHPMYMHIIKSDVNKQKIALLQSASYVSTTTPIFRDNLMKKLGIKNVVVFPNAIDPTESQFIPNPIKSDKVRFGWLGGSSHLYDIELMKEGLSGIHDYGKEKIQLVLCGFDLRGEVTEMNKQTGEVTKRPIKPEETVWVKYEQMFTKNYTVLPSFYSSFLKMYKETEYDDENMPYRRRWTKDITKYANNYNFFDVSLAPIVDTLFNNNKCIVGNSLISTTQGFKHISDIVNDKLVLKTEINGILNDVLNYFKYENVDTIKITTNDGYEIEGTPNHKIFINNNWVELKNLKIGDTIELTKPEFLQEKYQEFIYPMLLTKNITQEKIDNAKDDMLPRIIVNENWGRLLGYLLGDGNYNGSAITISCDKRHTKVVNDIVNLYESIGLNPTLYEKKIDKRCKNNLSKEGFGVSITTTCVNFLSISKKYNLCGKNGKTFRIPKIILESPKSVIKEFLKGLFEADGSVNINSSVTLSSKELKLIKQVQILLLGFDIQSSIYYSYNKHYRRYYYILNLRREGSEKFYKEIGFVSDHKKELLYKLVNNKKSNNFIRQNMNDTIKSIEYCKNTVYDIEINDVHSYNGNGIINHNSQLKVIEAGFHKKALIASETNPYLIDLVSAVEFGGKYNPNGNALLVPQSKNHKQWFQHMKRLLDNPSMIEDLGNKLYETVKVKYSLEKVNNDRAEFFKSIIKK